MKTLKSGLTLFDFLVYYKNNDKRGCLTIKDKGSKSQAISQLKRTIGKNVEIVSIKTKLNGF